MGRSSHAHAVSCRTTVRVLAIGSAGIATAGDIGPSLWPPAWAFDGDCRYAPAITSINSIGKEGHHVYDLSVQFDEWSSGADFVLDLSTSGRLAYKPSPQVGVGVVSWDELGAIMKMAATAPQELIMRLQLHTKASLDPHRMRIMCVAPNAPPPHPSPPPPTTLFTLAADLFRLVLENERLLHRAASWLMIIVGCCVLVVEFGLGARAPYGRHASLSAARYFGPTVPPRAAWIFQESWSVTVPLVLLLSADAHARELCLASAANVALLVMFVGHYAYRAFVYPLRMHSTAARMPIGLCLLATTFVAFNGYVQGRAWSALDALAVDSAASVVCIVCGTGTWALGLAINLHSDAVLRGLRRPGEVGYRVPTGGAFEYVSCANYFGEIVEWSGYALASGGRLPAVAFAFFTFANLAPRAHHHHSWYKAKFDEYPNHRRAVLPFLW